ncbi:hypothetical protein HDU78_011489 [Chytriomyces hyalinus]|nr:hypothetical protein HDU78_011489 [Chytriomyces hyalinus]
MADGNDQTFRMPSYLTAVVNAQPVVLRREGGPSVQVPSSPPSYRYAYPQAPSSPPTYHPTMPPTPHNNNPTADQDLHDDIMDFYASTSPNNTQQLLRQEPTSHTPKQQRFSSQSVANSPSSGSAVFPRTTLGSNKSLAASIQRGQSPSISHFSHFSRPYQSGSQWGANITDLDSDSDSDSNSPIDEGAEEENESDESRDFDFNERQRNVTLEMGEREVKVEGAPTKKAPRVSSRVMKSVIAPAPKSTANDSESDDDEAPLGVMAAQFKQQQLQSASRITSPLRSLSLDPATAALSPARPNDASATISNLLNSLSTDGKLPTNGTDLENLEGLVGALNTLITRKRMDEQQQQQQENSEESSSLKNANNRSIKIRSLPVPPPNRPTDDSEDDDLPLAQIHKASPLDDGVPPKPVNRVPVNPGSAMSRGVTNKSMNPSLKPKESAPVMQSFHQPPHPQQNRISSSTTTASAQVSPTVPVPSKVAATANEPLKSTAEPIPTKKITIRIHLELHTIPSASQATLPSYKTVILTDLLTSDMIVDQLLSLLEQGNYGFVDDGTWTLFEVCNDFGLERPLRDWEIVTDVVGAWLEGGDGITPYKGSNDASGLSGNKLWLKSYGFRNTLVPRCIIGKWPRVEGRFDMEIKPGKWKRRYFILREDCVYWKDRESDTRDTLLCRLNSYDVYTLLQARKKAPSRYCFALRSTASMTIFEKADEYAHFFCVDTQDQLADWVLGIRLAKNECMFAEYPDLFADYDDVPARKHPPLKPAVVSAAITNSVQQQQQALTSATGRIADAVVIAAVENEPVLPPTSLLAQSLAKKKEASTLVNPVIAAAQQAALTGKPLLSFGMSAFEQMQQNDGTTLVSRSKSKRASGGNNANVPTPALANNTLKRGIVGEYFNQLAYHQQQQQQQQQQHHHQHHTGAVAVEPATLLLDQITEAAEMPRYPMQPMDASYDDASLRDLQIRLDRAWELEQQQALALVEAVKSGTAGVAASGATGMGRRSSTGESEQAPLGRRFEQHKQQQQQQKEQQQPKQPTAIPAPQQQQPKQPLINLGLQRSKSVGGLKQKQSSDAQPPGPATLGRSSGSKPLIDMTDAKNCNTCGCSEFKTVYSSAGTMLNRDGKRVCGNCRHVHK